MTYPVTDEQLGDLFLRTNYRNGVFLGITVLLPVGQTPNREACRKYGRFFSMRDIPNEQECREAARAYRRWVLDNVDLKELWGFDPRQFNTDGIKDDDHFTHLHWHADGCLRLNVPKRIGMKKNLLICFETRLYPSKAHCLAHGVQVRDKLMPKINEQREKARERFDFSRPTNIKDPLTAERRKVLEANMDRFNLTMQHHHIRKVSDREQFRLTYSPALLAMYPELRAHCKTFSYTKYRDCPYPEHYALVDALLCREERLTASFWTAEHREKFKREYSASLIENSRTITMADFMLACVNKAHSSLLAQRIDRLLRGSGQGRVVTKLGMLDPIEA